MRNSDLRLENSLNDIFDKALTDHDQSIINSFKKLAEKLKDPNEQFITGTYSDGEVAGVEYCIYILESLIERRRKEKDASERDGEDL